MELCDGSLDKSLKNVDQKTVFQYFKQICEGIRVLHKECKIIHRDLKPGNILIKENVAKLCDFGEAREFKENMTLSNKLGFGTYEYLAPEIFDLMDNNNKSKYNEKSDIWALGIIFYKLLTKNEHPFFQGIKMTEENKIQIMKTILNNNENQLKIPPSIQPNSNSWKILNGCLEKEPKKRMDIVDILDCLEEKDLNDNQKEEISKNLHFIDQKNILPKEIDLQEQGIKSSKLMESWKLLRTLQSHSGDVNSVSISKDGLKIVSGSDDKTIKIWEVSSGKLLKSLDSHSDIVNCVCFSNDGSKIASGSYDDTIKIWEVQSGNLLKSYENGNRVRSVCFSPNGSYIACSYGEEIKLWDVSTGNLLSKLEGHSKTVNSICFSFDGSRIASGSNDKTVKLFNVSPGKLLQTFKGHLDNVNSVCFSGDCSKIVSGSNDKTINLWDISTGKWLKTFEGHLKFVKSVCFSPDGIILASGSYDCTIKLWDVSTGKLLKTLENSDATESVSFSENGAILVSGDLDKNVKIWSCLANENDESKIEDNE